MTFFRQRQTCKILENPCKNKGFRIVALFGMKSILGSCSSAFRLKQTPFFIDLGIQKRFKRGSNISLDFLTLFGSIWARFWNPNAAQDVPKAAQGVPKGAQDLPKTPQKPPKTPQRPPKTPQRPSKTPQRRVGGHFWKYVHELIAPFGTFLDEFQSPRHTFVPCTKKQGLAAEAEP